MKWFQRHKHRWLVDDVEFVADMAIVTDVCLGCGRYEVRQVLAEPATGAWSPEGYHFNIERGR